MRELRPLPPNAGRASSSQGAFWTRHAPTPTWAHTPCAASRCHFSHRGASGYHIHSSTPLGTISPAPPKSKAPPPQLRSHLTHARPPLLPPRPHLQIRGDSMLLRRPRVRRSPGPPFRRTPTQKSRPVTARHLGQIRSRLTPLPGSSTRAQSQFTR